MTLGDLPDREYRLRDALRPVEQRYEYILIDCPPALGLLTINAHQASRVFRARGTTTIAGVTITGGVGGEFGGGILNEYVAGGSDLTVTNSTVTSIGVVPAL